jgi:hypothetical protein
MEYILGALMMAVFFLLLLSAYWLGTKRSIKAQPPPQMDDEQKRESEKIHKHFKELLSYDVEKARQRKKVM